MIKIYLFACTLLCFAFPAIAQNVSSPSVNKQSEWDFNNTSTYAVNDNDDANVYKQKTRIGYGVTDRLTLNLSGELKQKEDNSIEYEETEFRVAYKLTGKQAPINATTRIVYDLNHSGNADTLGAELLLGQKFGKWRHLLNVDTQHDIGEKSTNGVELDFAWGTYYKFNNFRLGGEYLWDLGNVQDHQRYSTQEHQIGITSKFDAFTISGKDIALEFGYYQGVSRAADDHVFKNEIEFNF